MLLGTLLPAAQADVANHDDGNERVRAAATIAGCGDLPVVGTARFVERPSEEGVKLVDVRLSVKGLPDGAHAVHIHQTGACTPCSAANGHFDPGPASNTSPDGNHPFHSGDLINLYVKNGRGVLRTTTSRITLSPGPLSVFDGDGSAIIVHLNPDTYCPDGPVAGCAGGGRAACGVLEALSDDEDEWME
jgi:Cu-Zn family superoxide dismutase